VAGVGVGQIHEPIAIDMASTAANLRTILDELGRTASQVPADARDAALLALGWVAALRRSEPIGLDCEKVGTPTPQNLIIDSTLTYPHIGIGSTC
jgi:hypothetical protein